MQEGSFRADVNVSIRPKVTQIFIQDVKSKYELF